MLKLNGIKLGAAMLLLSCTVNASVIIDNQQIPTEDIVSINITPGTGTLIINTAVGYNVAPAGGTTPPPPGAVAITSFTASSNSFVEGGSTTLSWATQNATYCTPSNGTANWRSKNITLPSGSTSIQITASGSYGFTLTCTGAGSGTATRNVTVNVSAEPTTGSTQCNSSALTGNTQNWSSFWGGSFPGPSGWAQVSGTVFYKGYKALKFNTGSARGNGWVVGVVPTNTTGMLLGAISECPGDFAVETLCKRKLGSGGTGLLWSTDGDARNCPLQNNKDYYLNITYTDGISPVGGCTGNCQFTLQYNRY